MSEAKENISEETRKKMSDAQQGRLVSEETRKKMRETRKNISEETRKKLSDSHKGKHLSEEHKKKLSDAQKGEKNYFYNRSFSEEHKRKLSDSTKRLWCNQEFREKMVQSAKKKWEDPEYVSNVMKGLNAQPNKPEKILDAFLQKHFPNEWKYNGDFSCGVVLGRMIPDFVNVNGKKAVIEVFGDIYHNEKEFKKCFKEDLSWKQTEFGRKAAYSQLGYQCMIFWEHELKKNTDDVFLTKFKEEGLL